MAMIPMTHKVSGTIAIDDSVSKTTSGNGTLTLSGYENIISAYVKVGTYTRPLNIYKSGSIWYSQGYFAGGTFTSLSSSTSYSLTVYYLDS